jgi:hypothetical protein
MVTQYSLKYNYSETNNPENQLIRLILIQTMYKLLVTQQIFHRLIKLK